MSKDLEKQIKELNDKMAKITVDNRTAKNLMLNLLNI